MLKEKGIDLNKKKSYGPREKDGKVVKGTHKIYDGTDILNNDQMILRFIVAREWNLDLIVECLTTHLEWRQTNIPLPLMESRTMRMMKRGCIYVHGRAKDMSPLLHINF